MPTAIEPKKLRPIDLTKIAKRYQNKWIALSRDMKKVYSSGHTSTEVFEKAKAAGHPEAIITKLPPPGSCLIF